MYKLRKYMIFLSLIISSTLSANSQVKSIEQPPKALPKPTKQCQTSDVLPGNETDSKSPFRYIIFANYFIGDEIETDPESFEERRIEVLMEKEAYSEQTLKDLFDKLAKRFPDPVRLEITIHTSLLTIETPEENEQISDHSSRSEFMNFHQTASYSRFEDGAAIFLYDYGCPPGFLSKTVRIPAENRVVP